MCLLTVDVNVCCNVNTNIIQIIANMSGDIGVAAFAPSKNDVRFFNGFVDQRSHGRLSCALDSYQPGLPKSFETIIDSIHISVYIIDSDNRV